MTASLRIGAGAGFADDRIEPAVAVAGAVDWLVFETLAERTIARETQSRQRDPSAEFNPHLRARLADVMPACRAHEVRILGNMGGSDPVVREVLALQSVLPPRTLFP